MKPAGMSNRFGADAAQYREDHGTTVVFAVYELATFPSDPPLPTLGYYFSLDEAPDPCALWDRSRRAGGDNHAAHPAGFRGLRDGRDMEETVGNAEGAGGESKSATFM